MDWMVVVLGGTCLERSRQGVVVPGTTISVSSFLGGGCFRWYLLNELLFWAGIIWVLVNLDCKCLRNYSLGKELSKW